MLIFIRGIKLAVVLVLMGLGSCSLHSGFNPRGYGTGGENVAVGFGVAVLAGALMLFRKMVLAFLGHSGEPVAAATAGSSCWASAG